MRIIPTIKPVSDENFDSAIIRFANFGMTDFRYVLNKDKIQDQIDFVIYFQNQFKSLTNQHANIFLDIPCPKDKERIHMSKPRVLGTGDIITLGMTTSDVKVDLLPSRISSDLIRIGNSEALFKVIQHDNQQWTLEACLPCEINDGMPIASADGFITKSNASLFERSQIMIESLNLECLILSYVEDVNDISVFKDYGIKIMSKIESYAGVLNMRSIKDNSDSVFVARGCLGVNIGFENLFHVEKSIIESLGSENLYIGSNILRSLNKETYPTRSDCGELASLIDMGYDNFVITDGFSMYEKLQTFMFVMKQMGRI